MCFECETLGNHERKIRHNCSGLQCCEIGSAFDMF